MDRTAKWLTVLVMALVTGATVWATLTYGDVLLKLAIAYGPPDKLPQFYLWCALAAVCIAVWIATYFVCAAIQRSFNVWFGFGLLPVLLLAVGGANFGPHYAPEIWNELHYRWFEEADHKALAAVEEDNITAVIVNDDLCKGELEKLGYPEFMFAASLGAPHGLERARDKIKTARTIAVACQQRDKDRLTKFRAAIEALDISPKLKAQAIAAAFGEGQDSVEPDRIRLRQMELNLIDEFEAMLDDLAAHQGLWYAADNQIIFVRQRDLASFNAHVETARKLIAESDTVFARQRENARRRAEELRRQLQD